MFLFLYRLRLYLGTEVCMRKSFDDLTIADDFMFCKIM
ncbi:hypothetical protein HMPREF1325_0156 [Treponema socranskii subsp. socranskii VPI DR56BR1116 = ATCC 35536]|uniref:Uncharacterized protein n=1 Tax=Treponema socranskii subsp. socranskii VPI DR56BR1116 = ATCC 35536 TaxID=1125725 RepID=U1FLY3_TRESO|nr:hypothetical protein HMPREF1325_0156 [Treponema socranskii subsp. socranskii VPI DR56BR1116 = ATCC 35536]